MPSKHEPRSSSSAGLTSRDRPLQRLDVLVDERVGGDLAADFLDRCGRARSARRGSACRCRTRSGTSPAARPRRRYTLRAPASRAICTISRLVVPRTIESSTSSTFLPLNSHADRIELLAHRFLAHRLARHDEGAADVAVLDEAFAVLDAELAAPAASPPAGDESGIGMTTSISLGGIASDLARPGIRPCSGAPA